MDYGEEVFDGQDEFKKAGTHPVGLKAPNSWGLYDMQGNVWEWCDDVWQAPGQDRKEPAEPADLASADRVVRGGSWNYDARGVRAACRGWVRPAAGTATLASAAEFRMSSSRNRRAGQDVVVKEVADGLPGAAVGF